MNLANLIEEELSQILPGKEQITSPTYLLAVSGGRDSMAMLHAFDSLDLDFVVAHFNFKLRGSSSDMDEALVVDYCRKRKIPIYLGKENTRDYMKSHNLSLQEAARQLRYDFFERTMQAQKLDYLCTAHHGNDQLETFFIHLFRGSGLKGLTGIPQVRDRILRPMLWIPRPVIDNYIADHQIPYREDASNLSDDYLRNRIRHHVLNPLFKAEPGYLNSALRSIELLTEYQHYIDQELETFMNHNIVKLAPGLKTIGLNSKEKVGKSDQFLWKLYLLELGLHPATADKFMQSWSLNRTGTRFEGNKVTIWYDRQRCWVVEDNFYKDWHPDDHIEIPTKGQIKLPGGDMLICNAEIHSLRNEKYHIVPVDLQKVALPLAVRHGRPGDTMSLGQSPFYKKKLKKIWVENRIPLPLKERFYVLTDRHQNIISVLGLINSPQYTVLNESGKNTPLIAYTSFLLQLPMDKE